MKLDTPLRAENKYPRMDSPDSWVLYDADGKVIARGLTKKTAAAIVEMSEQNEKMREAVEKLDALGKKRDNAVLLNAVDILKAALAAGGEKV